MVHVLVGIGYCMYMLARVHIYVDVRVHMHVGTCICWYTLVHVYAGTCMSTCWCVCRYMWRNRWSCLINKIFEAMFHKLVILTQTFWELHPWHIDSGIEERRNRGKYRRILLTVYYRLSLPWKNIRNLISWEELKTDRSCK